MVRKYYKLGLIIVLCIIWVGWIVFLDMGQGDADTAEAAGKMVDSEAGKVVDTVTPELTATIIPTLTPTPMPTLTPTPVPTSEPEPDATSVPEATVTPEPDATSVPEATVTPEPDTTSEPETTVTPELDTTSTPTPTPAPAEINFCLAHVNEMLNVRSGPSEDAQIIGKMVPDSYGIILERGAEWYKIKSGLVTGYVYAQYLYIDDAAVSRARRLDALHVKVVADSINVRMEPNAECDILSQVARGQKFDYLPEKSNIEWCAIQFDTDTVAYLAANWVEIVIDLDTAIEAE